MTKSDSDSDRFRVHLIEQVVANVPRAFLEDFTRRAGLAYPDSFEEVKNSPTTLKEHRSAKILQDRMFRLEWDLAETARLHGLPVTSKPLPDNGWHYTYVVAGGFGLTQCYVPAIGELPQPAKYRDSLAKASDVPRLPIDDPAEIYRPREFYGLLAHSPVGRRFEADHQKLGSVQLCIPYADMGGWAFEMGVAELLSHYPLRESPATDKRQAPTWKPREDKRDTGTG